MRRSGEIAALLAALSGALFLLMGAARAQTTTLTEDDLYKAETIVTGTGEAERLRGFRVGAEEAVIKLTGKARLAGGPRIKPILDKAAELVGDFTYEDRMKGIPIHDEQGTRDRPHYLRIRFDKAKFDAALKAARLKKWSGARPLVAVWLAIREPRSKYVLASEGPDGYGQREVLKDASIKRGVPIVLPPAGDSPVTYDVIDKSIWHVIQQESNKLNAPAVLYGTLDFDGNVGWNTRWTLAAPRTYAKWSMKGVTFDVALKGAIEHAAAAFAEKAK
jgi:hypothetical protein